MHRALPRPIQLNEDDSLPRSQHQPVVLVRDGERGAKQRGQNVIGRMRRIMRMPIGHLWQQPAQGIQQIAVSPRVQVCGSEGARRMSHKDEAHPAFARNLTQIRFDSLRYIDNFVFLPRSDGKRFHNLAYPSLFADMLFSSKSLLLYYITVAIVIFAQRTNCDSVVIANTGLKAYEKLY